MSTLDIDRLGEKLIREFGCVPSFKNYNGYPASICVSVNDEVVHGIPTSTILSGKAISSAWMRVLSTKDIILMQPEPMRLASSVRKRRSLSMLPDNLSLRGLSSRKLAIISMISLPQSRLMQKASDTVLSAIWWATVSEPICMRSRRCRTLHRSAEGIKLVPGMTLAVEPMINIGTPNVVWMDDDWTVVTKDHSLSAHYENTILITEGEPEILSL